MRELCRAVCDVLADDATVAAISAPVVICGDIHGQFHDLLELFRTGGEVRDGTNYVFMGDLVDRGYHSLEVLTLLLLFKLRYPTRVTLLRGNHETRQVSAIYGFYDECLRKYGGAEVWRQCCAAFDLFAIAAIVDGRVLCVHGGLSPLVRAVDQIRLIDRRCEIPNEGAYCDIVWSDPDNVDSWAVSPRGAGWLFGSRVTESFTHTNALSLVCRAHQLVQEGYKYHFDGERIVTVWSAPNYFYRCGNLAAILKLDAGLARDFVTFREVSHDIVDPATTPAYQFRKFFL